MFCANKVVSFTRCSINQFRYLFCSDGSSEGRDGPETLMRRGSSSVARSGAPDPAMHPPNWPEKPSARASSFHCFLEAQRPHLGKLLASPLDLALSIAFDTSAPQVASNRGGAPPSMSQGII